ncbi:MAG: glycogen-binding domain-containing protein [Gemmatimonadota bacterium]|nr:glycogen-binding domain-containing protein [Gemmatimonadota bacterium]
MTVFRKSYAVILTTSLLALPGPIVAQTTGTLEAGPSYVLYDGFLASTAASSILYFQHNSPFFSFGAQGGITVFESGNQIVQATTGMAWRTRRGTRWHGEAAVSLGFNQYNIFAPAFYFLGRGRLHRASRTAGGWVGLASGASSSEDSNGNGWYEFSAGAWTIQDRFNIGGAVSATEVPPDGYFDVSGYVRWRSRRIGFDVNAGVRSWRTQPIFNGYADVSAFFRLNETIGLALNGGRAVSDPRRGLLGALYGSLGLRIDLFPRRSTMDHRPYSIQFRELDRAYSSAEHDDNVRVELDTFITGTSITITAQRAESVEIMGDFTDWNPVLCRQVQPGRWELPLPVESGVYRFNVRYDGGEWLVPEGVRSEANDFGGSVGIIVIP